jgi:uncharacterized protein (DUF433 family)
LREHGKIVLGFSLMIVDWSACPLVETKPNVQHGRPVVRGTRVTVDDSIVGNWEAGLEPPEITELFPPLTLDQVKEILTYAAGHQTHVPRSA